MDLDAPSFTEGGWIGSEVSEVDIIAIKPTAHDPNKSKDHYSITRFKAPNKKQAQTKKNPTYQKLQVWENVGGEQSGFAVENQCPIQKLSQDALAFENSKG